MTDVLGRLAAAEEALKNVHDAPRGTLKITASHGIGAYWLLPRLGEFLAEYPEVEVHLVMDDQRTGPGPARGRPRHPHARAGAGRPDPAQAVHRPLSHVRGQGVSEGASPRPRSLEEIADHTIIVYGETAAPEIRDINWLLERYKKHAKPGGKGRIIRINNITGILQAVEAGLGIGVVPDYVAAEHPDLVRVLPDVAAPGFDVHLVYADALRQSKRVAAFRDFRGQELQGLAVLSVPGARLAYRQ